MRRAFQRHVVVELTLVQALTRGREAIPELGLREAIVEIVARALRVGRQRAGARRLSTLNENEGEGHEHRQNGDPAPSNLGSCNLGSSLGSARLRPPTPRHTRRHHQARAIICPQFRSSSDHPPTAPISAGDRRVSARSCCGAVNPPGILPTPGNVQRTQNRVLIVGCAPSFRNDTVAQAAFRFSKRYQDTK